MKKISKERCRDLWLIATLLAVGLAGVLTVFLLRTPGVRVDVEIDGELVKSYPLSEETRVTLGNGEWENVLVIKDGVAFVESADCPDEVCVAHLPISREGETIVCLPHRLVIRIVGGDPNE